MKYKDKIRKHIRNNYGNIASKGSVGVCCSGSCNGEPSDIRKTSVKIVYVEEELATVPVAPIWGLVAVIQ